MTSARSKKKDFVAIAVAVVGVIVAIYFGAKSEKTKSYDAAHYTARPLLLRSTLKTETIEVLYRGAPVADPWLTTVTFRNSGDLPIEARDIEEPISARFGDVRVIYAETVTSAPPELKITTTIVDDAVKIEHGLINPGDFFTVDVLTEGEPAAPSYVCRISGISGLNSTVAGRVGQTKVVWSAKLPSHVWTLAFYISFMVAIVLVGIAIASLVDFSQSLAPQDNVPGIIHRYMLEESKEEGQRERILNEIVEEWPKRIRERGLQLCRARLELEMTSNEIEKEIRAIYAELNETDSLFKRFQKSDKWPVIVAIMSISGAASIVIIVTGFVDVLRALS